jgi:Concanavalin A-like lectin/glucanases superfamily
VVCRALLFGAIVACVGCAFRVSGVPIDVPDLAASVDGAPSQDLVANLDLAMESDLLPPFCGEPGLVACYRFEDATSTTVASDGTDNRNDLVLTAASETPGGYAGNALSVGNGGLAHIAHNATLDVQQLTIEMWVKPASLPALGARAGLLDEDGQYGLFIYPQGVLFCTAGGGTVASPSDSITAGAWQHVACTYDQSMLRLYRDGVLVAMAPNSAAIATGQPNGLSVGANSPSGDDLDGLVDDVRLFGTARTAEQICADAAVTGCR